MNGQFLPAIRQVLAPLKRTLLLTLALIIATVPIFVLNETATAAQITNRSLAITNGLFSATNNYVFTFTPATLTTVQSITIQSCTTALGTCTAPTGINLSGGTISQSGFQGATSFTKDTTTTTPVACNTVSNLCMKRTDATNQTATAHVITDTGAVNQNAANCSAAANCTFFERIVTYSDNAYATPIDSGTTASSTTQQFTVNAQVQEQLSFCIGNTTTDTATGAVPLCSAITGTSVNLGILSSSNVNITPVASGTPLFGDANNGLAELATNASNGTVVDYNSVAQSGTNHTNALRVAGATCNAGVVSTDQCINSIGTPSGPPTVVTAGTEGFGMTVAGVNCSNTTAYYACVFASGTQNLKPTANYDCTGATGNVTYPSTDHGQIAGPSTCEYMWDEGGTQDSIATSSGPVANEALVLKFAATLNLVTPAGTYTALADFVAIPTF